MRKVSERAGRRRKWLYHIFYISAGLALAAMIFFRCADDGGARSVLPFCLFGIAVLTNVEAGKNRFGRYRKLGLPDIVGPDGLVLETETMQEIDGAVERVLERGEKLLCINGGDGSMQRVITHLINRYGEGSPDIPMLFPLRGGTMNLLADHLKIKGKTTDLLRAALQAERSLPELPYVELPSIRLTREIDGRVERDYGFLFGNGSLYRFHRVYYRETTGGPAAAAALFAKCVFAGATRRTRYRDVFGLTPARVNVDGFQMPAEEVTIVLAVSYQVVVLSFDAFREEGEGDFYVIATSLPFFKMVTRLHKLLWARGDKVPYPREQFLNQRASRISMECREGYSLDGEVFEIERPYTLTIEKGPAVRFLDLGV